MKKYLLNSKYRIISLMVAVLYSGFVLFMTDSYALNPEQYFRPYSKILFVFGIVLILVFIKRKNWKTKVKALVLASTLVFIAFNTFLQLKNFFYGIVDSDTFTNTLIDFQASYRIAKIVLLDFFALFSYWSINKFVDEAKIEE